jgi:hypothetical protein
VEAGKAELVSGSAAVDAVSIASSKLKTKN